MTTKWSELSILLLIIASYFAICVGSRHNLCLFPDSFHPENDGLCENYDSATSLSSFCMEKSYHSNTIVTLLGGRHSLNITCRLADVESLTLSGQQDSQVVIECSPYEESGFQFLLATNLHVSFIEFSGCGSSLRANSTNSLISDILSALIFIEGSDLTLVNVNVSDSKSAGFYVYNVAGEVTIDSCRVVNASSHDLNITSGNVIAYDNSMKSTTYLSFTNCTITSSGYLAQADEDLDNCTHYTGHYNSSSALAGTYSSGLTLFVGSSYLQVRIFGSDLYNNSGCNGGNMAIVFYYSRDVQFTLAAVIIEKTNFTSGSAKVGGGMFVTFKNPHSLNTHLNRSSKVLKVANCEFQENLARDVGGGDYIDWTQSQRITHIFDIHFLGCAFSGNTLSASHGRGGLALYYKCYIDARDHPCKLQSYQVNLKLHSCLFHRHSPLQPMPESSVILAKYAPYLGISDVSVTLNNCTAILALSTTLVFYRASMISNNSAQVGAGVRLCSNSIMYFTPESELLITNNSAKHVGGGIFVDSSCMLTTPMCFYQLTYKVAHSCVLMKTVNITIVDNHAPKGGANIYGGAFDTCYNLLTSGNSHVPST